VRASAVCVCECVYVYPEASTAEFEGEAVITPGLAEFEVYF
jgi:hypothetical protein